MLLRNQDQSNGLNNGSQMIISHIEQRVIAEHLQGGSHDGQLRIILRISPTSLEGDLMFTLMDLQAFSGAVLFSL